jgi:hypothetical protein
MKRHQLVLVLTLFSGAITGCSQDTTPQVPTIQSETYEPCCGDQPVEQSEYGGRIYIPNVFTPNGDGINDFFVPSINDSVLQILTYAIFTPVGDTGLFHREYFDFNHIDYFAWDGVRYDTDSTLHKGLFKYEMWCQILIDSTDGNFQWTKKRFTGYACSIVCDPEATVFQTKVGCYFPSQASASGGRVDETQPSGEEACFK